MKPNMLLFFIILTAIQSNHHLKGPDNETIYKISKQLCWHCLESPFNSCMAWWAGQRQEDCQVIHSFPEGYFKLGENIYWGSGSTWTPMDAVSAWQMRRKGQQCGHYTQIVWKTTRKIGCARVVCDSGDVFMTCNYNPPGNYIGERPY
ncbi:hypothetical protein Pfo_029567 [Paulownia fortunei]|nr:hypothetical protein Pfo_029567 [Paulownia fortunei]